MYSKQYYVYILTNVTNRVLYVGVTNNLVKRSYVHKNRLGKGFTARYNLNKLVWYEIYEDIEQAILREKQIKAGSREKKLKIIESKNPNFDDLYPRLV